MALLRTVGPALEPVSIHDLKAQARIDTDAETGLIYDYILTARQYAEEETQRSFLTQTWQETLDSGFPDGVIELHRGPVQSITSITYVDSDGATQTLSSSVYQTDLNADPPVITLAHGQSWPATRSQRANVTITYVTGYGDDVVDIPAPIRQAIQMLAAALYQRREATTVEWQAFFDLLRPYKVWVLG